MTLPAAVSAASKFLPYGRQVIEDDDVDAVTRVLRGDYLTTGPAVEAFETALARKLDAPFAVACSSATAGLHIAALAAGLGPGDRAIVPAVTFLATANAVRFTGADVELVDVDPDTGLATPAIIAEALRRGAGRIKAVLPVHLAGQAAGPEAIACEASRYGALVIEDACHAIGAHYGRSAGGDTVGACRHAEMAVFSFHPVKTIAMGEGGAVTTRSEQIAAHLRLLRSHGMVRSPEGFTQHGLAFDADGTLNPWYYEMQEPGYNYRATDIHCALGLSQLGKLERFVSRRRAIVALYDRLLARLAPVVRPLGRVPDCAPAWHLYVALIDFGALGTTRGRIMQALKSEGIGSQVHYLPLHEQPYYRARYGEHFLPGASSYYARCLSLPLYPSLSDDDVHRVVATLARLVGRPA